MATKLELIMTNIVATATAINVASVPTFNTVLRGSVIGQALSSDSLPALGVNRILDRCVVRKSAREYDEVELVFAFQITAKSKTNQDSELTDLRGQLKDAFNGKPIGTLTAECQYKGTDCNLFVAIPAGNEIVAFSVNYVELKADAAAVTG